MLFRTTDSGRWGDGTNVDLTPAEIDGNFWELRKTLNDLIANPGKPVEITSVTESGGKLTFNMGDGSTIGPISMPVLTFRWRDVWTPTTIYAALDVFKVVGVGLFMVLEDHVSPAVFDAAFVDPATSLPAYLELFAFAPAQNLKDAIGFYYPGRLSDITSDVTYLYQEPMVWEILLPVVPMTGSAHQAYLQTAPSTTGQTFNVYHNDTLIGTVHFSIGANVGVVTINADETIPIAGRLAVGKALASDLVAAGLSVVFAAQQVAL